MGQTLLLSCRLVETLNTDLFCVLPGDSINTVECYDVTHWCIICCCRWFYQRVGVLWRHTHVLFVFAGDSINTVGCYDVTHMYCLLLQVILSARWSTMTSHTDVLLVLPGDSISTVECYDAIVGRWQITEAMTTLRSRVGVAVLKGKASQRIKTLRNSRTCFERHLPLSGLLTTLFTPNICAENGSESKNFLWCLSLIFSLFFDLFSFCSQFRLVWIGLFHCVYNDGITNVEIWFMLILCLCLHHYWHNAKLDTYADTNV